MQTRRGAVRFEPNAHPRGAGGNRLTRHEAVTEDDSRRRPYLQHLSGHFDAARMADIDAAAGTGFDGRARTPPRRPPGIVGEEAEDSFERRLNGDRPVELV